MNPLVEAIIILAAKYGPELVSNIVALLKKKDVTIEEIDALFANVKPYEAYNIPEVLPPRG